MTYEWNDPAAQSGITATNLYAGPIVIVLTDANGCTITGYATIDEPDTLVLFVSEDVSICYGQSVDINATAGGGVPPYDYIWDNGLDSSQIQTVAPLTTTTYSLNVIDANSCVSSFDSVIVSVSPPLVPVPQNDSICVGADAVVGVSVTGGNGSPISYLWSNWATDSVQTLNSLIADTTLTVTVSDGCSPDSTVTVEIWVSPNPDVSFTVDGSGCEPYELTAKIDSVGTWPPVTIIYWLWDFGDGNTSNDADSTTHVYLTAGTFDVSLQVISDEGCATTVVQQGAVVAYAAPTADFTIEQNEIELDPPEVSILSPTIDFIDASSTNVTSWSWDFGDPNSGMENTSDLEDGSHLFTDTGTYIVTLIVQTPDKCPDTITKEVRIIGQYILFAPNSFTPNDDGDNDFFFPQGLGVDHQSFELYIFDRWGDIIATVEGEWSNDISIGWDGKANAGNQIAQMDVYVWLIRTTDILGDEHEYIGHVTLLK
jgi:gliding motility-associated-like protein